MSDSVNPLIPAAYDIVWSAVAVGVVVLTIVALVSLARSARRLTTVQALVWTGIVLVIPLAGAAAWLAIGRRTVENPAPVAPHELS